MGARRIIKTIFGVIMIIGILVGMGYGISTLINSNKSAFYFEVNPYGETMEEIVVEDIIVEKGTVVTLPIPERTGYSFEGWYFDRDYSGGYFRGGEEVTATSNKTQLYARWSVKKYTVVIKNEFSEEAKQYTESVNYQKTIYLDRYISQSEEEGYNYRWIDASGATIEGSSAVVTGDCTFTRVREAKVYTIKYVYEENNEEVVLGECELSFSQPFDFSKVDMARIGHVFKDRCTLENGTEIPNGTLLDKNIQGIYGDTIVLYPVYEVMKFNVNFYTFDNAIIDTLNLEYMSTVGTDALTAIEADASLTRTHYVFAGWSYKGQLIDIRTFSIPAEDVDLIATYDKEKYSINYFINIGEIKYFDTITKDYGDSLFGTIPTDEQIATLIGVNGDAYAFKELLYNGYIYDKETFEQTFVSIDKDMEIEVVLKRTKLFINYIAGDGVTLYKSVLLDKNAPIVLPSNPTSEYAPTTSETGTSYEFGGWVTASGETFDEDYDLSDVETDFNVYSEWFEYNQNKWSAALNSDGVSAHILEYLGDYSNVCVPSQVLIGSNLYNVTVVGNTSYSNPVKNVTGRKVLIKSNITEVAYYAFYNLENVSVIFDNSESNNGLSIGEYAFGGLKVSGTQKSIKSIKLPKRTSFVHSLAFGSAINLERIDVASGCANYKSVDGVLYETKDNEVTLHTYPHARSVEEFVLPSDVTKIGEYAFYYFKGINATVSPLRVIKTNESTALRTIGDEAFKDATNLTKVDFSTAQIHTVGASAFENCFSTSGEKELLFSPNYSIVQIGAKAFYNCSYVSNFAINMTGLMQIGETAFMNFAGSVSNTSEATLSATISGNLTAIPYQAFKGCKLVLTITDTKVTDIADSAFELAVIKKAVFTESVVLGASVFKYANIKYIQFDSLATLTQNTFSSATLNTVKLDGVTQMEKSVFANNSSLETVEFGENCTATELNSFTFNGCSNLKNVTLYSNLKTIGIYAFAGCTSLTSITIPEGVQTINTVAFQGCSKLANVNLPTTLTTLGGEVFRDCTELKNLVFKGKLEKIAGGVFKDSGLTNLVLEMKETADPGDINNNAFEGAKELVSANLIVTGIMEDVFKDCTKLKFVYIKFVGNNSKIKAPFSGCTSLETIVLDGKVPTIENSGAESLYLFKGISPMKIYIPQNTKNNYLAVNEWTEYTMYLTEIDCLNGFVKDASGKLLKATSNTNTISIPSDVTALSDFAFSGMSNLKVLEFNTTSVLTASDITHLFDGVDTDNLVIKVPNSVLEYYKAVQFWEPYIDNIVGVDF